MTPPESPHDAAAEHGHHHHEAEHAPLHTMRSLEAMVVHVHPVVSPEEEQTLHELSGHHASPEALAAYRNRLADAESGRGAELRHASDPPAGHRARAPGVSPAAPPRRSRYGRVGTR